MALKMLSESGISSGEFFSRKTIIEFDIEFLAKH